MDIDGAVRVITRLNESGSTDITRTFDLIDKMKSGEISGVELNPKAFRIPFKTMTPDPKRALNCWCLPGAMVEMCPVHVSGKDPIYEDSVELAVAAEREKSDYRNHVLAKIWGIVRDGEDLDYDTNNLYDLIREGVQAKKDLAVERERCAKIADEHMPNCDGNDCDVISTRIRNPS
jgi:hypothetical protein